jgi:hypothetical protein
MPDPFLTDRVNRLAQSLVEELQNILADQDPEAEAHYVRYLAIRPILTGEPRDNALKALISVMAEILALSSDSLDDAYKVAMSCGKPLRETLVHAWNIKVQREKKNIEPLQ